MTLNPIKSAAALVATVMFALMPVAADAQPADSEAGTEKRGSSRGLFPRDVAGLQEMAAQAIEDGNGLRLLQTTILLRRQQPYEPSHFVNMVRAYAMMEKPTSAYHYMLKMQQQGLSYDFDQVEETAPYRGTEVYTYLNDLMIRAGDPAGEAEPVFDLDARYAFPSAIAWDESRGRFLVGTARDGVLLAISRQGEVDTLLEAETENGPWAIMDVAVDPDRNRLWLTSTAIPEFSDYGNDNAGRSGLFEYELDSLAQVRRYEVSQEEGTSALGAIALDSDGDVFVADRQAAVLYLKPFASAEIVPFLADQELNAFRDIAISEDGGRIYLADSEKGILVVDPEAEKAVMLEGPETLNLGGIEGLAHTGDELILVQSGIEPQRLVALRLDATGGKVEEVRPMAIALEWFDGPSRGTIHGDALYYFADAPAPGSEVPEQEVTVLRTALDAGSTIVAPDMRKFEEETLSKARDHQ